MPKIVLVIIQAPFVRGSQGGVGWGGVGWLGWAGLGWAGLGWAGLGGLGWARLGWAGLGWAFAEPVPLAVLKLSGQSLWSVIDFARASGMGAPEPQSKAD